jgi:hypothetical protein
MEWNDIELESAETYVEHNCEMEWEWNNVEFGMTGIKVDNDYSMEWE